MELFKKKISASEMGKILYNFTLKDESAIKVFSNIEGINLHRVRAELIFLIIFIVGDLLHLGRNVRERYGNKADEIFDEYLRCFKQQTDQDNTGDEFGASLEDRLTTYNNIRSRSATDRHWVSKLAAAFGRYCGCENNLLFENVAMQEFGLMLKIVKDFIDNHRVY